MCGNLCKSCGVKCAKDYEKGVTMVECPICNGAGDCEHCREGFFVVDRCPREYMGGEFIQAVNYASMSGKGDWPVPGGLLDQAAWFLQLKQELESEQNRIEADRNNG